MEQLVGTTLGRYRIERLLGRGGMAWVYQAQDPAFGRTVAVKVLSPKIADEPQFVERFLREARSMARLQHPHILPVYDVGEQQGTAYLVMLHVDGGSLHERLVATRQGNRLSLRELLAIIRPIGDALDYAHRNGVIHRDVKPQNILLTSQGYPFLTDFGIAKILDTSDVTGGALTQANAVIGTPDYMSPEQGQGMPLDGRSDLYSLGVILYEVFTGRTPFRSQTPAETPLAIMMRHITTPPPPPRGINPQLPPALDAVLLRALAKIPGDRYPTGTALIDALETAVESVRLPQSQGGMAAPSLSDFRLPPSPTPPGGQPSLSGGSHPGGSQTYPETAIRPPGSGPLPPRNPTPAPFTPGVGGPAIPATQIAAAPGDMTGGPPRRRGLLPFMVGGVALAVIALVAVLVLTTLNGGTNAGTSATNTPAGTTVAAASPPVTPTVPVASVAPASAPPSARTSASASAPASTSAGPSASAPASSSGGPGASPSAGTGGVATPVGATTTNREVILFSSHRNGIHESQIYTMNPDGSGQRILVNAKGHSWGPRVSPDGKFLVFSTVIGNHTNHTATGGGQQGAGHHEIFRARTDGGDITQITTTGDNIWNNAWAWTPDSKSIVFASDRDGNWELYRMNADGSNVVRLTNNTAQDGWPTVTPDGKSIIFASDRDGTPETSSQLYMMDIDGQNVRRLVFSEAYDTLPSISTDGKTVIYSSQANGLGEIYSLDLASLATTRLTSTVAMNTDPSFSPDGSRIVFTSDRDGNTNIYLMDRDGTNQQRITDDPGEDVTPFWTVIEVAANTPTVVPQAATTHPSELIADLPRRRSA